MAQQVKEIDQHAIIYPWLEKVWKAKKCRGNQTFPLPPLNMKKYLYKLFIKAKGITYYPQIILGLIEPQQKLWRVWVVAATY